MTKIDPSLENSNPLSDKKHNYPLKSGTKERVLSSSNIQLPSKTMKNENNDKDPMKKITDDYLDALNAYQEEVEIKVREDDSERRDQMKELDYHELIAHQEVARKKIYKIKEKHANIEKEVPIYANDLKERRITPDTYVSCIQMNTRRCIEKQVEIQELRKENHQDRLRNSRYQETNHLH